jgi:hypothetical protein
MSDFSERINVTVFCKTSVDECEQGINMYILLNKIRCFNEMDD